MMIQKSTDLMSAEEFAEFVLDEAQSFDGYHYSYDFLDMVPSIKARDEAIRQEEVAKVNGLIRILQNIKEFSQKQPPTAGTLLAISAEITSKTCQCMGCKMVGGDSK